MAGIVPFGYFAFCNPRGAKEMVAAVGQGPLLALLLTGGTILHLLYRATFFNWCGRFLQDVLRWGSDNYRTYIRRVLGWRRCSPLNQAEVVYATYRDTHLRDTSAQYFALASGVHLLYLSALLAFGFAVWDYWSQGHRPECSVLSAAGVAQFLLAWYTDRFHEDKETALFKYKVDDGGVRTIAARLGVWNVPCEDSKKVDSGGDSGDSGDSYHQLPSHPARV